MRRLGFLYLLLTLSVLYRPAAAEEITIAVASNFTGAMNELVAEFQQQSGHEVRVAYGSSGRFFAQIKNGAPFQLFFSADQEKPLLLEQQESAIAGSRFTYATGSLVLWSPRPNLPVENAEIIRQGSFNKLALANPRLAPYGVAAVAALESLNLVEESKSKWVQGENIAQAFQFVETGNADIGLIALSQLKEKAEFSTGSAWILPATLHPPIHQDAILLKPGENSEACREFIQFITSDPARQIIESYGYSLSNSTVW